MHMEEAIKTQPHSEDTREGRWLWLSFADDTGFLGVLIIKADDIIDACRKAHAQKLNPGGEVMGIVFPPLTPEMYECLKPYTGRLLTMAEAKEVDDKLTPLVPEEDRADEGDVSVSCASCNDEDV